MKIRGFWNVVCYGVSFTFGEQAFFISTVKFFVTLFTMNSDMGLKQGITNTLFYLKQ